MDADPDVGLNIFTHNRYQGQAPRMSNIGLPSPIRDVNLPTMIPTVHGSPTLAHNSDQFGELIYSPMVREMMGHSRGATRQVSAPSVARPTLWTTIMNAVFGGRLKLSNQNSATGNQTAATGGGVTDTVALQTAANGTTANFGGSPSGASAR